MKEVVIELLKQLAANTDVIGAVLGVIVSVVTTVWSTVKARSWYKESKWNKAFQLLEAAVEEVYIEIARDLKEDSDGRLTKEDIVHLQTEAVARLMDYGKDHAIDAVKILGEDYLPVLISRIVAANKTK